MDQLLLLLIGLLFTLIAGLLIFYFQTQQNFKEIAQKLQDIEHPQVATTSVESLKRDLAFHRDVLFLLEAEISKTEKDALTDEDLKKFDLARRHIKNCIAKLKANGAWIGLPYDYEWAEMLDRLPNLWGLYQKAELAMQAQEPQPEQPT
jgi:hypothetical protein